MRPANRRANLTPIGSAGSSVLGTNQRRVRDHNERLVLTMIHENGPLAKAEIARMSGLSAQTVSVIMRSLEAEGLLTKCEPVRGRVGQPSVPMRLASRGAFFFGLKVGRRSADLVLCDLKGMVLGRVRQVYQYPSPDSIVAFAISAATELTSLLGPDERARLAGLGVAIPFRLWDWPKAVGVEPAYMEAWRDRDIAAELAEALDLPVYLQNDGSAACAAELIFGGKDRPQDFLYFFAGFFIGGGIVMDSVLLTGRTGNAAALGPMPVEMQPGQFTHLLDVASLNLLEANMADRGLGAEGIWDNPDEWDVPEDLLSDWIEGSVEGLARATYSVCSVLELGHVIIDGWLPAAVRTEIALRLDKRFAALNWAGIDRPEVREGAIGSDARALGAAGLPLSETFLVKRNEFLRAAAP